MRQGFVRGVIAAAVTAGVFATVALAAPSNGGFENKNFSGWSKVSEGGGHWEIAKGEFVPPNELPGGDEVSLPTPPQGKYAAVDWQDDPSADILHRVIHVEKNHSVLSLQLAYYNAADDFAVPDSLALEGDDNQQVRVDLLKPNAPIDTVDEDKIVETLFQTQVDDPLVRPYGKLTTVVGKGNVRLRIAQVDNVGPLLVGVDAVKLKPPG